jgi:hypothetical protein
LRDVHQTHPKRDGGVASKDETDTKDRRDECGGIVVMEGMSGGESGM